MLCRFVSSMMCTITNPNFTVYKSVGDKIVELNVPVGSRTNINRIVVDPKRALFSADKVHVLRIYHKETKQPIKSVFFDDVQYNVGDDVKSEEYDPNPNCIPVSGTRFFLNEEAARDHGRVIKDGLVRQWYDNGQLLIIGMMKNGKEEGEWKLYHMNGKLAMLYTFVDGRESGLGRQWREDGSLDLMEIYGDRSKKASIFYRGDGFTMIFNIYDMYGNLYKNQEIRCENIITEEAKMNHMNQLLNTGNLVLSHIYEVLHSTLYID